MKDYSTAICSRCDFIISDSICICNMIEVRSPQNVTLENIDVGSQNAGATENDIDIHQIGADAPSRMTYDNVIVFGTYAKQPLRKGLRFTNLGSHETVVMPKVTGNLILTDCARATILGDDTYEGSLTVQGRSPQRGGFLGFETRLSTLVQYDLDLRDNQNIVVSDFYVEQNDNVFRFEGEPGEPPGRATIQGAKVHQTPSDDPAKNNFMAINDYGGQIFFGPDQLYVQPQQIRIRQQGAQNLEIFLFGCSFYNTQLDAKLAPSAKLFTLANAEFGTGHAPPDAAAPDQLAPALDDLRRLGAVDVALNHGAPPDNEAPSLRSSSTGK